MGSEVGERGWKGLRVGKNPVVEQPNILQIDAESVVLYQSMDDFYGYATVDRPSIDLVA